jgi:SAM-dependent methyltransferase
MIQRLDCPICRRRAEPIFSRPYGHPQLQKFVKDFKRTDLLEDRPFEVRFCPACDLCFQTWVMDRDELDGWYSPPTSAEAFRGEIARQKLHWFAHMTEEILVIRQLVRVKLPRVLDFGCNWGKWASMALAHGCDVYAVEVNRDAAAFCASRGINIIAFAQLPAHHFDFINVDQVAEHLADPMATIQSLASRLTPGGFLKLSTPGNRHLPRTLRQAQATGDDYVLTPRTLDSLAPLSHVNLFTAHSLQRLGCDAGLESFRAPFLAWLGAGQLWNQPRQFNHNLVVAWKRWLKRGTYQWFRKPAAQRSADTCKTLN